MQHPISMMQIPNLCKYSHRFNLQNRFNFTSEQIPFCQQKVEFQWEKSVSHWICHQKFWWQKFSQLIKLSDRTIATGHQNMFVTKFVGKLSSKFSDTIMMESHQN